VLFLGLGIYENVSLEVEKIKFRFLERRAFFYYNLKKDPNFKLIERDIYFERWSNLRENSVEKSEN
jgi:hypothetical protein